MKPDKASVQEQAAQLPHRERAQLALRLIESLDPGHDEDVDELWLDEEILVIAIGHRRRRPGFWRSRR